MGSHAIWKGYGWGQGEWQQTQLRLIACLLRSHWLKNTEVVDLLSNYRAYDFRVSKEAPVRPLGAPAHVSSSATCLCTTDDASCRWHPGTARRTCRQHGRALPPAAGLTSIQSGPVSWLTKVSGAPADDSGVGQYRGASFAGYGVKLLDCMHQVHLPQLADMAYILLAS